VFKATPTSPTQMQQITLTSPGNAMIASTIDKLQNTLKAEIF
jgi:hypothetical protein